MGYLFRQLAVLGLFFFAATAVVAQKAADAVILFQGPKATGAGQSIPVGTYRVDGKQMAAAIGKDAVISVRVPTGLIVRFCNEAGKCETFASGTHDLGSTAFVLIKVWRDIPAVMPVVVFESENWMGRAQAYPVGMYRSIRNEFGNIADDKAVSIIVAKGFRARLCVEEGVFARGAGDCEEHNEGKHNLRFSDSISFIEVIDLNDRSPADESMPVVLYVDEIQGGKMQGFDVGEFAAGKGHFRKLPDNTASSLRVKKGYRAMICPDEAPGGNCDEYGEGNSNLKQKDSASYLKVWKTDK